MAFYDPALPGRAAARAYLLKPRRSFADVVSQEMRREVGEDLDLSRVLATGRQVIGPGRYETLIKVGEHGGHPDAHVHLPGRARRRRRPHVSAEYATMVGNGLREAHGWTADAAGPTSALSRGTRGVVGIAVIEALLRG